MITTLLYLVIIALVLGLIVWIVEQVPFTRPFAHIIRVIAVVIFVIYVIYILIGLLGHGIHVPTS